METTLVTTTRDRALCFSLLERWVGAQTVGWDQWLVVNDGTEEYTYTMGQEVVRRDPSADTMPSICANWLEAIPRIKGDKVIVLEDDDYYSPRYLALMLEGLSLGELAGITHDVYYRFTPAPEFLRVGNASFASLGATGFRSGVLPHLEGIIREFRSVWIDQHLWADPSPLSPIKTLRQPFGGDYLHVGMKRMPGAAGLGLGHAENYTGWTPDPDFGALVEFVGAGAAEVYRGLGW